LLLADIEVAELEISLIETDNLAAASIANRCVIGHERRILAGAKIGRDLIEIIAEMAAYAGSGDDDLASVSSHKPISLSYPS
jgi:hypothetical protein